MEARNCRNRLGLSDEARSVLRYADDVKAELRRSSASKAYSLGDLRLYECPLSFITSESAELMRAVYATEAVGQLPCEGGWMNQPHWFIEAFEIYKAETVSASRDEGNGER
ncbi:MAG: hypothetical protein HY894_07920 [Deltaproteobacteria bacterium]|nr:hypothetical protein [Deltaproteobacteria bacterium]